MIFNTVAVFVVEETMWVLALQNRNNVPAYVRNTMIENGFSAETSDEICKVTNGAYMRNITVYDNVRLLERGDHVYMSHDDGYLTWRTDHVMIAEWDPTNSVNDIDIDAELECVELATVSSAHDEYVASVRESASESAKRREATYKAVGLMEELGFTMNDLINELEEIQKEEE